MRFLTEAQIEVIRERFGTPVYVYDEAALIQAANEVTAFPAPCRLVGRYAMKALPNRSVLKIFDAQGLHVDASSGFEAERALAAGIAPEKIQITAQEIPKDLKGLIQRGVLYNACSIHQLRTFGALFPGGEVSVRINPGLGSGHNNRTNVGGPASSFGIWHAQIDEVLAIGAEFELTISGLHTHIGSGGDPEVWKRCAAMTLEIARKLPDLNRLSLGGGFKVARLPGENSANLQEIGRALAEDLAGYVAGRGDAFQLEIEPGSYLVANAGAILAEIIDVVDTHTPATNSAPAETGHNFLKVDTGMTELLRPSLYGAQHPIHVVAHGHAPATEEVDYVIAGHCCESGDILTPAPGDSEGLAPRRLAKAEIGDTLVIEGTGAYAAGMAAKNYNAFPEAAEVMLEANGELKLIRMRQTLDQILQNEI